MGAFNTVGPPDNGTLLCKINHKWVIWFAETLKQPIKDYFCGQASQFQVDVKHPFSCSPPEGPPNIVKTSQNFVDRYGLGWR